MYILFIPGQKNAIQGRNRQRIERGRDDDEAKEPGLNILIAYVRFALLRAFSQSHGTPRQARHQDASAGAAPLHCGSCQLTAGLLGCARRSFC